MIDIPDELIAARSAFDGDAGRAFVAALPDLAESCLERWGLRPDGPSMYGMCALVLPVVREEDGRPAALKLQAVDEETVDEPVALRAWTAAGAGAVELLDHDPQTGALLLERLDERRPLSGEADVRGAVTALGAVLARLVAVVAPDGLRTLGDVAVRMLAAVPDAVDLLADASDRRLLADCAAAVREVAAEPGDRLLHWDLHYDNILAGRASAGRAGEWVALDPKPLAGDPGFELFPALGNLFDPGEVLWRFDALTDALGLERDRARAWTLGRVLQTGLWAARSGERRISPDHAEIARRLMGRRGGVGGVRHDGGMAASAGRTTRTSRTAGSRKGGSRKGGVAAARRPEVRLPPLVPYDGEGLEQDGDYDGIRFDGVDLADASGRGARFMDCALDGCGLDRTDLARARFIDAVLTGVRGVGTDLAEASLRDVEVVDARLGGVQLHGAVLERVVIRGGKIDYLNLRRARLKDVVFEGCVLFEPDFGDAHLVRVEFRDCALKRVDFSGARMESVDLREVAELDIARGVERLAGAVISPPQLMELAPAFAAQIGVRVEA